MNQKKISVCFINDSPSIQEGIFSLVKISKNQLKQSGLKKAFLEKKIRARDEVSFPINVINRGLINPNYDHPKVNILFEDENMIVLSKPVRIHCHPLGYDETDNILSFLRGYNSKLLEINISEYDRGLLYRLDFETSGLLYYVKSNDLYQSLRKSFNVLVKEKYYYAVVDGKPDENGRIETKLSLSSVKGSTVKVCETGKTCQIYYEVLKYNEDKDISLIKVRLFEGFKHQIRVQLKSIGHPICGDQKYNENSIYKRMYLHCYQYKFQIGDLRYNIVDDSIEKELKLLF